MEDSWRKANRNDYSSLGAFTKDKCTGYEPPAEDQAEQGSLNVIDSFETQNPYQNRENMVQFFTCSGAQSAHIRLDSERGFATEEYYDILTVSYTGYWRQFSGGIEHLDERFGVQPDTKR